MPNLGVTVDLDSIKLSNDGNVVIADQNLIEAISKQSTGALGVSMETDSSNYGFCGNVNWAGCANFFCNRTVLGADVILPPNNGEMIVRDEKFSEIINAAKESGASKFQISIKSMR